MFPRRPFRKPRRSARFRQFPFAADSAEARLLVRAVTQALLGDAEERTAVYDAHGRLVSIRVSTKKHHYSPRQIRSLLKSAWLLIELHQLVGRPLADLEGTVNSSNSHYSS